MKRNNYNSSEFFSRPALTLHPGASAPSSEHGGWPRPTMSASPDQVKLPAYPVIPYLETKPGKKKREVPENMSQLNTDGNDTISSRPTSGT